MPYCQNCAKKVSKDDEFCPSCGERTKTIKIVKDKTERKEIVHIYKFLPDFPRIHFPKIDYGKIFKKIVYIILILCLLVILYNIYLLYESQIDRSKGFDFTIPFTDFKKNIIVAEKRYIPPSESNLIFVETNGLCVMKDGGISELMVDYNGNFKCKERCSEQGLISYGSRMRCNINRNECACIKN